MFNTLNSCFGSEYRKFIFLSLIDYSALDCFDLNTQYLANDEVLYDGVAYKALVDVKGIYPTACEKWEELPKFNDDCLNALWEGFLEQYLSNIVAYNEAPTLYLKVKTFGVVKIESDNFKSVSLEELQLLRKNYLSTSELLKANMEIYIKENNLQGCFDLYLDKDCCKPCGCLESTECSCSTNQIYEYNVG